MSERSQPRSSVSVVVPVYNSSQIMPKLVDALEEVLPGLCGNYELILVNDGSPDRSWEIIQGLCGQHGWIKGINLTRNYGQHNALLCGIREAQYDVIVTMDDDLQHPPQEIAALLAKLTAGFDVVYGTPLKEQRGLWRKLGSRLTRLALKSAMRSDIAFDVSAFRAFRASLREGFERYQGPLVSIDVLLTWTTVKFAAVAVRHQARASGTSTYSFRKLASHSITMMTGFSNLPLRFASLIGFAFTLLGLCVLAFVVISYLAEGSVPGFPFLASIVALFSGAQLFAIGVIGEYVARVHSRTMDKPAYVVRESTSRDPRPDKRHAEHSTT